MKFDELPLHDASIVSILYKWESHSAKLTGKYYCAKEEKIIGYSLDFQNVKLLDIPHKENWGPSSQINSTATNEQSFIVEMQSGDVLFIEAEDFEFKNT